MSYRLYISRCTTCAVFLVSSLLQTSAFAAVDVSIKLTSPAAVRQVGDSARLFDALTLDNTDDVRRFYIEHKFKPVWFRNTGLQEYTQELLEFIDRARLEGLVLTTQQRKILQRIRQTPLIRLQRAQQDILLTDLFMSLARFAAQGQMDPRTIDREWHYERPQIDTVETLQRALDNRNIAGTLAALLPQHQSYKQLVKVLASYTQLAEMGGWPVLSLAGASLAYGHAGEEIILLRQRLRLSGDLAANAPDEHVYDYELEQAVKEFQRRHGLVADGVVGQQTRKALHATVVDRIAQIRLNLERWRWLPRDLGERHIRVNMAGFELQVHDNGQVPLSMRVIVGKPKRKTPAFSRDMNYLVFNPYWNVPNKLAREDLIPHILQDPEYFLRKKIRVLTSWGSDAEELDPATVDWSAYRDRKYLPFKFRQDPGERNSLGRLKFMLPNPYSVYLHDTPSRRLFDRPVRTFSSGCVRLENPVALASYVMGEKWQEKDILGIIRSNKNRALALPEPIPVHMLYQTVWVDGNGTLQFRDDIYNKDTLLTAALPGEHKFAVNNESEKTAISHDPLSLLKN